MEGKWMFNLDGSEMWQGEQFDTKQLAIEAGRKEAIKRQEEEFCGDSFQVGQVADVSVSGVNVDNILEDVAENTVQGMEAGEDYLYDVTKEDSDELEQKLNDVLFAWIKQHGYDPNFFQIENEETIIL